MASAVFNVLSARSAVDCAVVEVTTLACSKVALEHLPRLPSLVPDHRGTDARNQTERANSEHQVAGERSDFFARTDAASPTVYLGLADSAGTSG